MRPWGIGLALVLLLGVGAAPAFQGVDRPQAVLAPALATVPDGAATQVAWPANDTLPCRGLCATQVPSGRVGELWVWWDGAAWPAFGAALEGQAGTPAFDAVRLGSVAGGESVLVWGNGTVHLVVLQDPGPVPELAALVPTNVGQPLGRERGHGPAASLAQDCLASEVAPSSSARCLRFTTGVANVGAAALALSARQRGETLPMVQALPDGDRLAGTAAYHEVHGHFHYARFATFQLHGRDADGTRGAVVASAEKTGFCMVDFGPVEHAAVRKAKSYWRHGCAPDEARLSMGISPGWYDIYRWFLPEQTLDASGLPDGTYELVVTIDPDGTLVEGNPLDNRASLVFRWQDGKVVPITGHGLYRLATAPT